MKFIRHIYYEWTSCFCTTYLFINCQVFFNWYRNKSFYLFLNVSIHGLILCILSLSGPVKVNKLSLQWRLTLIFLKNIFTVVVVFIKSLPITGDQKFLILDVFIKFIIKRIPIYFCKSSLLIFERVLELFCTPYLYVSQENCLDINPSKVISSFFK